MKRRIVKKINRYKVLPPRLVNKAMYIAFRLQEYWSLGINSKKYYNVYVMDKCGRVLMYSRTDDQGRITYGHGYKMWNEDELYHIRNKKCSGENFSKIKICIQGTTTKRHPKYTLW